MPTTGPLTPSLSWALTATAARAMNAAIRTSVGLSGAAPASRRPRAVGTYAPAAQTDKRVSPAVKHRVPTGLGCCWTSACGVSGFNLTIAWQTGSFPRSFDMTWSPPNACSPLLPRGMPVRSLRPGLSILSPPNPSMHHPEALRPPHRFSPHEVSARRTRPEARESSVKCDAGTPVR